MHTMKEAPQLFERNHDSLLGGHLGIFKTRNMLTSTHYWPGVTKDNANWVTRIWELVGMDLIGPLPVTKDGYQYILTTIDYLSRWVEAFPLRSNSASEVAKGMYKMIVRRGCPQQILTNLGPEFNNKFNLYICERLRIASPARTTHKPMA
ncbi:unnamed protein product [Lepidochelys kempii]